VGPVADAVRWLADLRGLIKDLYDTMGGRPAKRGGGTRREPDSGVFKGVCSFTDWAGRSAADRPRRRGVGCQSVLEGVFSYFLPPEWPRRMRTRTTTTRAVLSVPSESFPTGPAAGLGAGLPAWTANGTQINDPRHDLVVARDAAARGRGHLDGFPVSGQGDGFGRHGAQGAKRSGWASRTAGVGLG